MCVSRSNDNFLELVISFHPLAFGDGAQVNRPGIKCPYPLSHLAGLYLFIFFKWKSSYQPQQQFLKRHIMQSRDLLIWCMRRGDGKEHSCILFPITELRFLEEQNPLCAVFTSGLESEQSTWGLALWELSFYEACLSGVQSRVAAKLHSTAQLRPPETPEIHFTLSLNTLWWFCVPKFFYC